MQSSSKFTGPLSSVIMTARWALFMVLFGVLWTVCDGYHSPMNQRQTGNSQFIKIFIEYPNKTRSYVWGEVNWLFNITINDISVIYVTAHLLDVQVDWRSLTYGRAPNAIYISWGSLTCPTKHRHEANLFIPRDRPIKSPFTLRWGYRENILELTPGSPRGDLMMRHIILFVCLFDFSFVCFFFSSPEHLHFVCVVTHIYITEISFIVTLSNKSHTLTCSLTQL